MLGKLEIRTEKLITYTSAHYELYIKTAQILFVNCFKKIILSLFTIETSKVWVMGKFTQNTIYENKPIFSEILLTVANIV